MVSPMTQPDPADAPLSSILRGPAAGCPNDGPVACGEVLGIREGRAGIGAPPWHLEVRKVGRVIGTTDVFADAEGLLLVDEDTIQRSLTEGPTFDRAMCGG
jgi:hypothetical protein